MARLVFVLLLSYSLRALASGDGGHGDPSAPVVLALALMLAGGKLVADLAVRLKQPAVLGELLFGVILGNLPVAAFAAIRNDPFVDMLARLGVLILLFEVGLESTVAQMLKVGWSSFAVAVLGVAGPFVLGVGVSRLLLAEHSLYLHLFIGATLSATSVGITARVLKDLGQSQSDEARIILGAAVIDDVLGLILLAVVTGVLVAANAGQALSGWSIALTVAKSTGFLVGALVLGVWLAPRIFHFASRLRGSGVLLATGLGLCFFLAWVANQMSLAPIVGAFAAGLILEDLHYRDFQSRGEASLDKLLAPLSSFLSPIFFVLMGMRTDLQSFAQPGVLGLAGALTVAAIVGKQVAGLGVFGKASRLSVGIGMIPRGEVGLIFANIGLGLRIGDERIVEPATFSAIVVMVIATTFVTPPLLKWSLGRRTPSQPISSQPTSK